MLDDLSPSELFRVQTRRSEDGVVLSPHGARLSVYPGPPRIQRVFFLTSRVGDDVLVRSESVLDDGTVKVLWSLYEFSNLTLIRAQSFQGEREALAHAA
jgi:hypothetical protein